MKNLIKNIMGILTILWMLVLGPAAFVTIFRYFKPLNDLATNGSFSESILILILFSIFYFGGLMILVKFTEENS